MIVTIVLQLLFLPGSRLCYCWRGGKTALLALWAGHWCPWNFIGRKIFVDYQSALIFILIDADETLLGHAGRSCNDWWWSQRWQTPVLVSLCIFTLCCRSWYSQDLIFQHHVFCPGHCLVKGCLWDRSSIGIQYFCLFIRKKMQKIKIKTPFVI